MPDLARITATFFVSVINRLGIRPPFANGFEMSNVVQPVSIVDSDITLSAISTAQTIDTPATQGQVASPVGGTLLADTGQLLNGTYSVFIQIGKAVNNSADFLIQRRNAANAANIWEMMGSLEISGPGNLTYSLSCILQLNERIRVIEFNNAGVTTVEANIWTTKTA
jgi:hypothetical protein